MSPDREDLILRILDDLRLEMREEFTEVKKKQDYTNGDVRDLKLWRAKVEGAFASVKFGNPFVVGIAVSAFTFGLTRIFG